MNILISNKPNTFAIIDDEMWATIIKHNPKPIFSVNNGNHVFFQSKLFHEKLQLSRLVLGLQKYSGTEADHENRNTLDNRKGNLRELSDSHNGRNKARVANCCSNFRCVVWDKRNRKWQVQVSVCRKPIWGGRFDNEMEAAIKADDIMISNDYDLKSLNFPIMYGA